MTTNGYRGFEGNDEKVPKLFVMNIVKAIEFYNFNL